MSDGLSSLNVPEILRVGIAGLCFLLSLLSFYLIRTEQQREGAARQPILRAIYTFMGVNFLIAVLVAASTYLSNPDVSAELSNIQKLNARYKEALTRLSTSIDGKVKYEMEEIKNGNIQSPAMRVYIGQLDEIIKQAERDGLIAKTGP